MTDTPVEVPPDRNLGDPGHINDHNLLSAGIEALDSKLASKLPYSFGTATPSTTDSGFLWYDSNSTPAAPKFWDGAAFQDFPNGLTLITSESFTTVSSISVNGCFTSAYRNYRMVVNASSSANSAELHFRFRASGSDDTSNNYIYGRAAHPIFTGGSTTFNTSGNSKASFANLFPVSGSAAEIPQIGAAYDIFAPHDSTLYKTISGMGIYSDNITSNAVFGPALAQMDATTAFDGFSLFTSSGTISGIVNVYGYGA